MGIQTFEEIFIYDRDKLLLKNLLSKSKHIAFSKAIIEYLAKNHDPQVPELIINFSKKRFSKGFRASLILVLDDYDISAYLMEFLSLFLKDSYNTTWYCYDLLLKHLGKMDTDVLLKFSDAIILHDKKESDLDKKDYHKLLVKKINSELKRRKLK